ncbi:diguanylate cyclase (GGDEF)-like protein [Acetoanaerobium pronyense]|uniref:Diguanylate cyclase (GGDEF)-like protein n=2 Tax=Acetoanaerobium pronyense TaxID=1482736 RepID=A0ABS4KMN1_9FIRM|nr:diguanylate cyclase (GGDEF)-like protein [Acetoanaerobium pronyense]
MRYRHRDGSTIWIRCRGLAIRDEYGKPIRMLGAHTDITDLKETEQEISRLTKEYEKVFNGTQDAMFLIKVLEEGRVSNVVGSATDITERKILELELEKYANYDKLTGLPNRRLFFERLNQMVLENERYNTKFALLFIDLDGFKEINDSYGHEVGDEVLIIAGNRLLESIRKSDTVARMGGDEFTIIIRNIEDKENIDRVIKKIHTKLQEDMVIDDVKCNVNSSIGIAIYPDNGLDSEELLKSADEAMYEIKKNGKGGFKFSNKSIGKLCS